MKYLLQRTMSVLFFFKEAYIKVRLLLKYTLYVICDQRENWKAVWRQKIQSWNQDQYEVNFLDIPVLKVKNFNHM